MEEKSITIKKSTLWMIATFVVLGAFLIYIIADLGSSTGNVVNPTNQPGALEQVRISLNDDDPVLGNPDAKISVVEFSDFECPFCARGSSVTLAGLKASSYFLDGDVNIIYKHLPLTSIHPNAQKAAEASECARQQGKFWEYHDVLFMNQQTLGIANLKQYAADLGLDTTEFNSCLDGGKGASKVSNDMKEANLAGARGTPHFVVYNKDTKKTATVSGAVPFENLEATIQSVM